MFDYWELKFSGYSRLSRGVMSVIVLLCTATVYELCLEWHEQLSTVYTCVVMEISSD